MAQKINTVEKSSEPGNGVEKRPVRRRHRKGTKEEIIQLLGSMQNDVQLLKSVKTDLLKLRNEVNRLVKKNAIVINIPDQHCSIDKK